MSGARAPGTLAEAAPKVCKSLLWLSEASSNSFPVHLWTEADAVVTVIYEYA